jgi:hypothetical protein
MEDLSGPGWGPLPARYLHGYLPTSPSSVVVEDVDVDRTGRIPAEDDPPLIVDPDAMVASQVASQGLEPVARGRHEVAQCSRIVQHVQLSGGDACDLRPSGSLRDAPFREEAFNKGVGEALDRHHAATYLDIVYRVKVSTTTPSRSHAYAFITRAMIMRLTDIGSQYLIDFVDSKGEYLMVARPTRSPCLRTSGKFWSFTVYDNQTRSMLDTPQRYPRAGSQSFPTPAAEASADRMMSMGHERRSTGPHRGGPPRAASRVAAAICAQGCEDALFGRSLV